MGEIIRARLSRIKPTEFPTLCQTSLVNIMDTYFRGQESLILPPAVKLEDTSGYYLHLDGLHRLALAETFGNDEIDVFLARNKDDTMPYNMFPHAPHEKIDDSNFTISDRFSIVERQLERVQKMGIYSISDVRKRYSQALNDEQVAYKFYLQCASEFGITPVTDPQVNRP